MQGKLPYLEPGDDKSMPGGAVKCFNPWWTTDSEGTYRERVRRSGTKAGGAKRIRYPCSPSSKRCPLCVVYPTRVCSAVAKALNGPPG